MGFQAMSVNTNPVRQRDRPASRLDAMDRKLLGLLAEDATRSYADLGRMLNLSPPAVHERVKKLKSDGVIKGISAVIDGVAIGRPLLAFVHVDTQSWAVVRQLLALEQLPAVEEIHTVTGETAILLKVRTRDTRDLEALLAQIHAIEACEGTREGSEGTRSYVALSTYLERGPSPEFYE
jgi:Lrp/AsnC family transcriptional regulator, leucine-responsive regulatory protein